MRLLSEPPTIGDKTGVGLQKAVQGTGAGQYIDYRGKKVVGAWRYIPSLDWGMVAKIDADEAFADVTNLRNLVALILGDCYCPKRHNGVFHRTIHFRAD